MWSGLGFSDRSIESMGEVVRTHERPTPPTRRRWPSLANYADQFIFVIAGYNPDTKVDYDSTDLYNIETNVWQRGRAQPLNKARDSHSSCVAGHILCVFGGYNGVPLNSIEFIDAKAVTRGERAVWEIIECNVASRMFPLVAPFSSTEVLISGGENDGYCMNGFVFNVNDKSIKPYITLTDLNFAS